MVDKINGNSSYDFPGSQKRKNPALKAYENTPGSKDAAGKRTAGSAGKNNADAFDRKESGVILDLSGKAAGKKKNPAASQKKDAFWKDALRKLTAPVVRWLKDFWNSDSSGKINASSDSEDTIHTEPSADGLASMQLDTDTDDLALMQLDSDTDDLASMQLDADADDLASMQLDRDRMQQTSGQSVQRTDAGQDLKALADRAVKSGDLRQIERVLTQNGAKRLAHNSDLLTYYDRRGKFVEMDETEKHRVLFGDKNVLKL
ncbi:MAG: hypothetical protein HFH34_08670 [Eubacterium sp.]|nr:hypothetical protein [Eubacterium sp.]